jgi:anti-anti-sigma factor
MTFEKELQRLLSGDAASVILDITQLRFIDSTGLQCLVRATERSRRDGGRLRVIAPAQGEVDRILRLTGVRAVLPLIQ